MTTTGHLWNSSNSGPGVFSVLGPLGGIGKELFPLKISRDHLPVSSKHLLCLSKLHSTWTGVGGETVSHQGRVLVLGDVGQGGAASSQSTQS